ADARPPLTAPEIAPEIAPESASGFASAPHPAPIPPAYEPIAIVGMSGRFPDARDIDAFWSLLMSGRGAARRVDPHDRFAAPRDEAAAWLAPVPGIDEFDPLFFDIAPAEAQRMDPRERLLLQHAWLALEDAGIGARALADHALGMFVGAEAGEYGGLSREPRSIVSDHNGVLAARLSYFLDLTGPNLSVNTACSSGLVALHLAIRSLHARECGIALAAGVNLMLSAELHDKMARAGMLSQHGVCRALDRDADGFVPGEAVVVVALKRLADALADGDAIHGVIRASGVNYDGRTNGMTAPSGLAQARLLTDAWRTAGIDPAELGYVVAHGTGTRLGDPVELNALGDALRASTGRRHFCAVTSNKPNVGHTLAASGLVSLVNLVEALRRAVIPPSAHWREGNEFVAWGDSPLRVNTVASAWPDGARRLGGASAFGMSGTNAHVIVEAAEPARARAPHAPRGGVLFVVSAKTGDALAQRLRDLADCLASDAWSDGDLADVAHTLLHGRQHFEHRSAVFARGKADAIDALRAAADAVRNAPARRTGALRLLDDYAAHLSARYAAWRDAPARDVDEARRLLEAIGDAYREGATPSALVVAPAP
ncbi:beta-ketoacyl synthase N-terminal-like domain-containing protein, partial [Burkholderia thailandensis]